MATDRDAFERWYRWAGVPVGTTYPDADRIVSEAVATLEAERDDLRGAIQAIIDTARAGAWEGPEIPDPVAAAIASAGVILRRPEQAERWTGRPAHGEPSDPPASSD